MPALLRPPAAGPSLALRRIAAALAVAAVVLGAASCGSPAPTPTPTSGPALIAIAPETPAPSAEPTAAPDPSLPAPSATSWPAPSAPAGGAAPVSPAPFRGRPVATRVVITALGIDLAVVKAPRGYPYCDVAMSFAKPFGQPGEKRATYIFAHARDGMFGPIYQLVMFKHTPNVMVGMLVDVYTSDDRVHTYRIARVLPHQRSLDLALAVRKDQLWLQTSEGPHGTPGKTMLYANPVSVTAADHAAAHPAPHVRVCG
jgi:hypothetical protein